MPPVLFSPLRQLPHSWHKAHALCRMAETHQQIGKYLIMEKLTMRATLPEVGLSNARNYGGEKETVSTYKAIARAAGAKGELLIV